MRNLQEQVKKSFCYQKLFWPFTVWINFSNVWCNKNRTKHSSVLLLPLVRFLLHQTLSNKLFIRLSLKNVRVAVRELESFSATWMEALLIQSSAFLIMKSVDMRITQALALKQSTPGGQSLPKSFITMLLPEKFALLSLKAHVKLKSMLFYLSNF